MLIAKFYNKFCGLVKIGCMRLSRRVFVVTFKTFLTMQKSENEVKGVLVFEVYKAVSICLK